VVGHLGSDTTAREKFPIKDKIPQHNNNRIFGYVMRYSTTTAETVLIDDADPFKMICSSLPSSTVSTTLPSAYRIKGVRLSGLGDGSGVSNIILKWGDDRGPDQNFPFQYDATAERSVFVPTPKNSFLSKWLDIANITGTTTMFTLDYTGLNGTFYLDVHVDYLFSPKVGVAGPTVASGDDGIVYPNFPSSGSLAIVGFYV